VKILLVGEANPYGGDPGMALYPLPERASGHRLCVDIMQLSHRDYLQRFDRINLSPFRWRTKEALQHAGEIMRSGQRCVLLGAKVAKAFGYQFIPFVTIDLRFLILPHPSGLCRLWNQPGAYDRARLALREFGALDGEPASVVQGNS
jgi:hypothetical protein